MTTDNLNTTATPSRVVTSKEVTDILAALGRVRDRTGDIPDIQILSDFLIRLAGLISTTDQHVINLEKTFQTRLDDWCNECFGPSRIANKEESCARFIEEVFELAQSIDFTPAQCILLLDYVYKRPKGRPESEVGGVVTTLSALCSALGGDMMQCGEQELNRIYKRIPEIRQKDATKPLHSPLPGMGMYPATEDVSRPPGW